MTGLAKHQPNTITDAVRLRREVATVRRQGYATDIKESDQNYSAIAVPILGPGGDCVAATAVAMPVGRMPSKPSEMLLGNQYEAEAGSHPEVGLSGTVGQTVNQLTPCPPWSGVAP